MTLKEKFENNITGVQGELKIADEFAIEFGEYLDGYLQTTLKTKTITELLEIYKKEKGL